MNCLKLAEATSWNCAPVGRNSFLAHAPMPLGSDGQLARFYILNDSPDSFFLTDAHAAILHAADHGSRITKPRLKKVSVTPGLHFAKISDDGEITASGSLGDLQLALWDALRATLAITNNEQEWLPRIQQDKFATRVHKTLKRRIADNRIISKPKLVGASGRQIEFPLGVVVDNGSFIRAIQTIGVSENRRMDWGYIYQSLGKLTDLKKASSIDSNNRLVIIEGGAPKDEFSRAATALSDVARVLEFSDSDMLAELVAA